MSGAPVALRVRTLGTLLAAGALLAWQVALALASSAEALGAGEPGDRVAAARMTHETRLRRELGERRALLDALSSALAAHPRDREAFVILWLPPGPDGRDFDLASITLFNHLRTLLFPTTVRVFSSARPAPPNVEAALDGRWYVVDMAGEDGFPWAERFATLARGADWTLRRVQESP